MSNLTDYPAIGQIWNLLGHPVHYGCALEVNKVIEIPVFESEMEVYRKSKIDYQIYQGIYDDLP